MPTINGGVDAKLAQVPLLGLPNKVAGYVSRISHQLNSIIASPGITSEMRMLAMQLGNALTNVKTWLEQVHQDAKQLVMLTDTQLLQHTVLLTLDDMQTEANNAFVGRTDPSTNKVEFGMKQINNTIQELANFDVMAYPSS